MTKVDIIEALKRIPAGVRLVPLLRDMHGRLHAAEAIEKAGVGLDIGGHQLANFVLAEKTPAQYEADHITRDVDVEIVVGVVDGLIVDVTTSKPAIVHVVNYDDLSELGLDDAREWGPSERAAEGCTPKAVEVALACADEERDKRVKALEVA